MGVKFGRSGVFKEVLVEAVGGTERRYWWCRRVCCEDAVVVVKRLDRGEERLQGCLAESHKS
jgi:hypothetical protein